jgi:hypothetical protein
LHVTILYGTFNQLTNFQSITRGRR